MTPTRSLAPELETLSEIVGAIVDIDSTIASLQGLRAELLHQANIFSGIDPTANAAQRTIPQRSLRAELACAMRIPERTAERLIAEGSALTESLPGTLAALRAGAISYRHAQLLVDAVITLGPAETAALENAALPLASILTATKFDRRLRSLRERLDPESMTDRHVRATRDREVQLSPSRDGMAWLTAFLPAADAVGIFHRLTEMARGLQRVAVDNDDDDDDDRTLTQLRADALRDLLIDGEIDQGDLATVSGRSTRSWPHGIRPTVFVTVPALTLLGRSDDPATLDGYGPVDANTARDLAARAPSFIRLLTHPETGAVMSVGRESYRVPADLKNWLRVRDGTCRFPGCARSALLADIDHTTDWARGGETRHDNLAHLCRGHHSLKHSSGWTVRHATSDGYAPGGLHSPGSLRWTSPTGREYTTHPEVRLTG